MAYGSAEAWIGQVTLGKRGDAIEKLTIVHNSLLPMPALGKMSGTQSVHG